MSEHFPTTPPSPIEAPKRSLPKKRNSLQGKILAGMLALGGTGLAEGCAPNAQGMHDRTSETLQQRPESREMVTWRLFQIYEQPGMTNLLRYTEESLSPNTPSYNVVADALATAEQVNRMKQEARAHHPETYRPGIGYSEAHEAALNAAMAQGGEWVDRQSAQLNELSHLDVHTQKWVLQGMREAFHRHPDIPLNTLVAFAEQVGDANESMETAWQAGDIPHDQRFSFSIQPEQLPIATSLLSHFPFSPHESEGLGENATFSQLHHFYIIGITHNGGEIREQVHIEHPERSEEEIRRIAVDLGLKARIEILHLLDTRHP